MRRIPLPVRVLSSRDRRALATGAVVVGALVAGGRGLPALSRWEQEARAAAAESSANRARAERSVGASASLRDSLARRAERLADLDDAFLRGDTPAAAVGALASIVADAASTASLKLGPVEIRPDTTRARAFARVAVRVSATGDVDGITQLLLTLERGPTLLVVRELSVTQPEPAAPDDRVETLRMELVVAGLARRTSTMEVR